MLEFDYRYDLYSEPFFTLPVDTDNTVVIKVKHQIPFFGVAVKLSRCGGPGDLCVRVGSGAGKNDIAEKYFAQNEVPPLYEVFLEVPFPEPCVAKECFITVQSGGALPLDGYRIFGPRQGGTEFDPVESIPYWWSEEHSWGMMVPKHYKPGCWGKSDFSCVLGDDGAEMPSVSIRVYDTMGEKPAEEGAFEFTRGLFGAKYTEWALVESPSLPLKDEIVWQNEYNLDWQAGDGLFAQQVVEETEAFFKRVFGLRAGAGTFVVRFVLEEGLTAKGHEGHVLNVSENCVEIQARSIAGLQRGLHYIEDVMLEARRPCLKKGVHQRDCLYETRMTSGIYPAPFNYFVLKAPELWTDEYMWRAVRAGYNAVWFNVNMEDITSDSKIFPHVDDGTSETALVRLRRMTETAARYGANVYIELRTGYYSLFPEEYYDAHPELRTFRKWGNTPCMNTDVYKAYLQETIKNLFDAAPLLAGLMLIYDTEGFYTCFANNHQKDCPNCNGYTPNTLAEQFFGELAESVKSAKADARIIAWTYYCDEDWNYELLGQLPKSVTVLSCFSQFVEFERFGVKNRTDDYACCVTGPGEYFKRVYDVAHRGQLPILAKTELSQGQEFVSVPYIPALVQHQKRWDALRNYDLWGFMGDYIHSSFSPSACTDIMRLNIFDTTIEAVAWQSSKEKLRFAASLRYGAEASKVQGAWACFSTALTEYFPYSAGVCRYPGPLQAGPTQPFYLDANREIKRRCARYNTSGLWWTGLYGYSEEHPEGYRVNEDWNDTLLRRCFVCFGEEWRRGIALLTGGSASGELKRLREMAQAMLCMVDSMVNFIDFVHLRDAYAAHKSEETRASLLAVCLAEKENVKMVAELCRANARLGFSCEGQGALRGGYYNAYTIDEKLRELGETIRELR